MKPVSIQRNTRNIRSLSRSRPKTTKILNQSDTDHDPDNSRNVNEYQNILDQHATSVGDVSWILSLRTGTAGAHRRANSSSRPGTNASPTNLQRAPSFYDSPSNAHRKKNSVDVKYNGNTSDVIHLMVGRVRPTPHLSQVAFESGLRGYQSESPVKHRRNFSNIPMTAKKDPNLFPEFLPPLKQYSAVTLKRMPYIKKMLTEIKGQGKVETISAFEGPQAYQQYTNAVPEKNMNVTKHLFRPNQHMATVLWECGLRS